MEICLVGGSGIISTSVTKLLRARGHSVTCVTRGNRRLPDGVEPIVVTSIEDGSLAREVRYRHFDAVVDFLTFDDKDAERAIATWKDRTNQYIFISSASCYKKPAGSPYITESTPLANPHWDYSRKKISAELTFNAVARDTDFPLVTVRPSLTYGDHHIPLVLNSWSHPYTIIDRMKRGQPVVLPGDGASLWTITHADDFAYGLEGLIGNPQTLGHAFHITSDESITWRQAYEMAAAAFNVPFIPVEIASHTLAKAYPDWEGTLLGDKAISVVFDNSKIKRFVPDFVAKIGFAEGMRRAAKWFLEHPGFRTTEPDVDARHTQLSGMYHELEAALVARIQRGDAVP